MKKFLLFLIFIISLYIFSDQVDLIFPVQYKEGLGLSGLDASLELIDPTNTYKASTEFVAGISSCELYANVKVSIIWNPDSAIQGETLTVRVLAQPVPADNPSIYTNFGFSVGAGVSAKSSGIFGGQWVNGPGIGYDFNMNIECIDTPPMGTYSTEEIGDDDVVDFLSLIPETKGASEGLGAIISNTGDTLLSKDGDSGSGSDALGLFDFLSLKLSGGLKINDGHILTKIFTGGPDEQYFNATEYTTTFYDRTDTLYYKIYIDSFAPESSVCYLYIQDPSYFVNLFQRMGMELQSLGLTVASTYWLDNDKYEDKGIRELKMSDLISYWDRMKIVPIKVTGEPLYRPDFEFNWFYVIPYNYWGDYSDYFAEAQCTTLFRYSIYNHGDTYAPECSVRIVVDNDTLYNVITYLDNGYAYDDSFKYVFTSPGEHYIECEPNYNHLYEEYSYENNKYTLTLPVVEPVKLITLCFANDSGRLISTDSLIRVTIKDNKNIQNLYWNSGTNYLSAKVPGSDTLLISILPDTTNTHYYITSKYLDMNLQNITGDTITITLQKFAKLTGTITNAYSEPVESVFVQASSYSTYTDTNGVFIFDKIIPLADTFQYSFKISNYKFFSKDSTVHLGSGDSININMALDYQDTIAPYLISRYFISGILNKNDTIFTPGDFQMQFNMNDNYSGIRSIEIKNINKTWQEIDVENIGADTSLIIDWECDTTLTNNTWQKFYYRIIDMAYNTSDSILDSVYYVVKGPVGTFTILDSITKSPNIRIQLNAIDSSGLDVEYAVINTGFETDTFLYTTSPINVILPSTDGTYSLLCTYYNEFDIPSSNYTDNVQYTYIGKVNINNDALFTNSANVNLYFQSLSGLGINNASYPSTNSSNDEQVMQTFKPNTNKINGVSVNIYCDSMSFLDIYYCELDTLGNPYPISRVGGFEIPAGVSGWYYGEFSSPLNVTPGSMYSIMISSISDNVYAFPEVYGTNDTSYTDGSAYVYDINWDTWGALGFDFLFKIYNSADSVEVSNSSDMSESTKYAYTGSISWTLNSIEGNQNVYSRFSYGSSWDSIINDAIVLDTTKPIIDSIKINNHKTFTNVPACTLVVYYSDNYSPMCSLKINSNPNWIMNYSGNAFTVDFSDSNTGTKTISVQIKDLAGNISNIVYDSIDYDSTGILFSAFFNNSTEYYIPDKYPTININVLKNIVPESLSYGEYFSNLKTIPFVNSVQCTLDNNSAFHQMIVRIKDNYSKESTQYIWAFVDSTPPPELDTIWKIGNGINDTVYIHWNGIWKDNESGLKELYIDLMQDTSVVYRIFSPLSTKDTLFTDVFDLYNTYYIEGKLVNNANLYSYKRTSFFTVNNTPDSCILIYPHNDNTPTQFDFLLSGFDKQTDSTLCFRIDISTDNNFTNIIRTFNGKTDFNNWSKRRYASGDTAIYSMTANDSLNINTKYYYRVLIMDSVSEGNYTIDSFYVNSYSGIRPDYFNNIKDYNLICKNNILKNVLNFNIELPKSDYVKCSIYDSKGTLIKTIVNEKLSRGGYKLKWDLTNNYNKKVASGNYFIITNMGNKTFKEKIILLK